MKQSLDVLRTDRYDAVVVGAGPNGLAAAIRLQQAGLSVLLIEGHTSPGGGARTAQLTLPGFFHDVCSAIHPLALASPFFQTLPLRDYGLEFAFPDVLAGHPLDDGSAALLLPGLEETANALGADRQRYMDLVGSVVHDWSRLDKALLGPLRMPAHPLALVRFGLKALPAARHTAARFQTPAARGLLAGMAAHAMQPLSNLATSAIALVLLAVGHVHGWPVPIGGSEAITRALVSYFNAIGGTLECGQFISSLDQLPPARAVLLNVSPAQLQALAGNKFTALYNRQLSHYRYGMGVFKLDWALDGPIPFRNASLRQAGTVHLGGTLEEIAAAESATARGSLPARPFVLLAQQSVFDPGRAPAGKHTAWAYCHVPNSSLADCTALIEAQVERFAPGFKKLIKARHTLNTAELAAYNPNYVGGDINCGVQDLGQLFSRPVLKRNPYRTPAKGVYLCSSATPPGGGVHGMCGFHAAETALNDLF